MSIIEEEKDTELEITQEDRKEYVEALQKSRDKDFQSLFYSIQRLDILTISISGAGVYVVLETLKYRFEHLLFTGSYILKFSGALFVLAALINCLSQYTSYKAHQYSMMYYDICIEAWKNEREKDESFIPNINNALDAKARYNSLTKWGNLLSLLIMFGGLSLLIVIFFLIF
ncbi:MAG: hypothetical protein V4608_17480 [Bacteroidota bacterium]